MGNKFANFLICFLCGLFVTGVGILVWKFVTMVAIPIILAIKVGIPKGVIVWVTASFVFAIIMYLLLHKEMDKDIDK